jgi:hypothetical protein
MVKLGQLFLERRLAMPYVDFKAIKAAVSIDDTANLLNLPLKTATNCAAIVPHAAMKTNASSLSRRLADSFIASMRKSAEIFGSRPAHIRVGRTRRGRFLIPYRGLLTIPQPPEQKKAAAPKRKLPSTRWHSLPSSNTARCTSQSATPTARSAALSATQRVR